MSIPILRIPLAVRRRLDIFMSLRILVLVIRQIKAKNEPVNDVVFMEIFKSLEQLLHETFYYNSRD